MAESDEFKLMKKENEVYKMQQRKGKLEELIRCKRIQTAYKNEQSKITNFLVQEDNEERKEEPRKRGYLNLSKHKKVHKQKITRDVGFANPQNT